MKKNILFIFCILFYGLSQAQLITDSLLIDGYYRIFHFNKPQQKNTYASLIFVLHGSRGKGQKMMEKTTLLESKTQTENILLVYPQGYKNCWNDCRKASDVEANVINIDENSFFAAMIYYFKTNYQVNDKQVFAIGFSGGGHLAYKLALTMPEKFKGITAIVANLPDTNNMDCTEKKIPVAVMIVNGTADPVNPYAGGEVKSEGLIMGKVRSTEQSFNYWATLGGYKGTPLKKKLLDRDTTNNITIERYSYGNKNKPEVVLLKVINGKHELPEDIDVFMEAWKFFKRQIK